MLSGAKPYTLLAIDNSIWTWREAPWGHGTQVLSQSNGEAFWKQRLWCLPWDISYEVLGDRIRFIRLFPTIIYFVVNWLNVKTIKSLRITHIAVSFWFGFCEFPVQSRHQEQIKKCRGDKSAHDHNSHRVFNFLPWFIAANGDGNKSERGRQSRHQNWRQSLQCATNN